MSAFLDVKALHNNENLIGRFDGKGITFPGKNIEIQKRDIISFNSYPFRGIKLKALVSPGPFKFQNYTLLIKWLDPYFFVRRYLGVAISALGLIASYYSVKLVFHPIILFFPIALAFLTNFYFKALSKKPEQLLFRTGVLSTLTMIPLILVLPPFIYFIAAYIIAFVLYFISTKLGKKPTLSGKIYSVFFWLLLTSGFYEWQLVFFKWHNDALYQTTVNGIQCDYSVLVCSGPGGYWKLPSGWSGSKPNFLSANFNADLTRQIKAFPHTMYFQAGGGELYGTLSAADAVSGTTIRKIYDYIKENQTYMWALPLPADIKPEIFRVRGIDCMVMALEFYSLKKMGRETLFLLAAAPGQNGSFLFLFRLPAQGSLPYYIDRIASGFSFIERK